MDYTNILESALAWGKNKHPESSSYKHCAFANSVAYLVTGFSGGYRGTSVREHCVSWAIMADWRLPRSGKWEFEIAREFAENICYGELPELAYQLWKVEHCFDDDPEDIKLLNSRPAECR